MHYKIILGVLFTLGVGFFLSRFVDITKLTDLISDFPKLLLVILLVISLGMSVIKAWRFMAISNFLNVPLSFWESVKIYIAGQSVTFLPGGEIVRGTLLAKESNVRTEKIPGPIFLQAYTELLSASVIVLIGSLFYRAFFLPALTILVLLVVLFFGFLHTGLFRHVITLLELHEVTKKHVRKIKKIQQHIATSLLQSSTRYVYAGHVLFALATHLLGGVILLVIAKYYGAEMMIGKSMFIYASSLLLQGLSLTPGGIGVTEGGMSGVMVFFGIPSTTALAIVVVFRCITLIFQSLIGVAFLLGFYGSHVLLLLKKRCLFI